MYVIGKLNARAVLVIRDAEPTRSDHDQHDFTAVQRRMDLVAPIAGVQCVFVEKDLIRAEHLGKIIAQRDRPSFGIGLPITNEYSRHAPPWLSPDWAYLGLRFPTAPPPAAPSCQSARMLPRNTDASALGYCSSSAAPHAAPPSGLRL